MPLNLSSLCRLCMSETKPLFALFNSNDNIAGKIREILPLLKVSENDGLPSKVCESCLQNINIFYDFKIQCEISEETLLNYLACQHLVFKPCWKHVSPSGSKAEEQHIEPLLHFVECKTEIHVTEDVKFDPKDVSTDLPTILLENNMEQPQKEKSNIEPSKSLEEAEPADAFTADEHSSPTTFFQENHLEKPQKEKKKMQSSKRIRALLPKPSDEEEICECAICGTYFNWKYLQKHVKRHAGAQSYVCSICEDSFSTNYDLKTHLLLHTGQHSYMCGTCEKQFTLASRLPTAAQEQSVQF